MKAASFIVAVKPRDVTGSMKGTIGVKWMVRDTTWLRAEIRKSVTT